MRYIIPALLVLLSGCSLRGKRTGYDALETPEKLDYLNFLETEVGTAASTLIASKEAPEPYKAQMVDITIDRLSGIIEPENREVQFWRSNFSQKAFLEIQQKEASRVKERSEAAWKEVETANRENQQLKAELENERKKFASMVVSVVGGLGIVAGFGMLLLGYNRLNAGASILAGMVVIGSVWIYDNPWFMWIGLVTFATAALEFVRRLSKSRLTNEKPPAQ